MKISGKKINNNKSRRVRLVILGLIISVFLCSCKKINDDEKTIFLQDEKKDIFKYTYVQRGDIDLSYEVSTSYVQAKSENYAFSVKDRAIKNVCVSEGDDVTKGQVLAELDNDNVEDKIKESNYVVEKNTTLIKQAKQQRAVDLQEAEDLYNVSKKSSSDKLEYNKKTNNINTNYDQTIEDYENAIEIEKLKLDSYHKKDAESKIYSGITGTVSFVKPNLVGTYSDPTEAIITVVDNANCVYETSDMEYKSYFINKTQIDLHVKNGDQVKIYHVKPTSLPLWKSKMVFILKEEGFTPKVGDYGYIYANLGHRKNVLYVDKKAIHKANGKYYVYVLDSDGNREMKTVTIGLQANESTEIVSGLKEGEKIVLTMDSIWGE